VKYFHRRVISCYTFIEGLIFCKSPNLAARRQATPSKPLALHSSHLSPESPIILLPSLTPERDDSLPDASSSSQTLPSRPNLAARNTAPPSRYPTDGAHLHKRPCFYTDDALPPLQTPPTEAPSEGLHLPGHRRPASPRSRLVLHEPQVSI
jgi:hypothetical protein